MLLDVYLFHKILLCHIYGSKIVFNENHCCENCSLSSFCDLLVHNELHSNHRVLNCIVIGGKDCNNCSIDEQNICNKILSLYFSYRNEYFTLLIDDIINILRYDLPKKIEKLDNSVSKDKKLLYKILIELLQKKIKEVK